MTCRPTAAGKKKLLWFCAGHHHPALDKDVDHLHIHHHEHYHHGGGGGGGGGAGGRGADHKPRALEPPGPGWMFQQVTVLFGSIIKLLVPGYKIHRNPLYTEATFVFPNNASSSHHSRPHHPPYHQVPNKFGFFCNTNG